MGGIWPAILVFLIIGGAATVWILAVRLRREEQRIGLRELSAMHWREFQRLVVAMMEARGFMRSARPDESSNQSLLELERGGETWLLSTHHGAGYVPGNDTISELASAVQLRGATGAWLTTPSTLAPALVTQARLRRIELLDWPTLWSEIRPLLDPAQRREIVGATRSDANRNVLVAWAAASVAGVCMYFLVSGGGSPQESPAAARPAAIAAKAEAPDRPAPGAPPAAGAAAGNTAAAASAAVVPDDPQALAARRTQLTRAVGTLPWVDRAVWSTQSTLVVYLAGGMAGDRDELCQLMDTYPELRASRLQLQPPADSNGAVRFTQCRSY